LQNWQKDGQILTLKNNVLDAKSETKKWLWWFIGACAFIIVENGLILYLRSKGLK
jgi:bacteriorhodopsin